MLVEIAVADAYGAGFEFAEAMWLRIYNDLSGYVRHPRFRLKPGSYTDDTQMTLAVTEALLSGQPWTTQLLADHFVQAFRRDPREGYARNFYAFLQKIETGEQFLREIRPVSDQSGAAMRAGPLGLLPDLKEVLEKTDFQARITHDTPDGRAAACAAAAAVHYCRYGLGPLSEVGRWVASQVPGDWAVPWLGEVGGAGRMTVRAALTALGRATTMSGLLKDCVAFTGDVDTVAVVAMAAASVSNEIARDLPAFLFQHLEDGPYGKRYIEGLDARLRERFG